MTQINENRAVSSFSPLLPDEITEAPDVLHIGNTIYEVHTHFNLQGRQSVLEQFRKLLLANNNLI
jgi:hypothetical protein